jgi:hypothetical protein
MPAFAGTTAAILNPQSPTISDKAIFNDIDGISGPEFASPVAARLV